MSATDPKGGESACEYPRDVYPVRRDVLEVIETQEQTVRRLTNERWQRRAQALMPTGDNALVHEFGTWVAL